jgi:hypothetical protein
VADEISYGTHVVGQFLGERQRFAYETGQTLPQRVVEAFDVIVFRACFVIAWCRSAGITPL